MDTKSTPFGKIAEEIFAANLRRWQGERTNADCARILGVSEANYGKYLKADRLPGAISFLQIARAIGVSPEALLSEQMASPPNHGRDLEETIRQIAREEIGSQIAKIAAGESDVPGLLEVAKVFLKEAGIALGSKEQLKRGSA
jgi:transcriptional regulator with XRE-family HTH domain